MPTAITEKPLNARLPAELAEKLEVFREYLEVQTWQLQDIQTALDEAHRRDFATEKEVIQFFSKYSC
jgi:predicted transcriptional regulator